MTAETRFRFGQNWRNYALSVMNHNRLRVSVGALQDLTGMQALTGKTFLDIGCGSGLQTASALLLGAERVRSIDIDTDSVDVTQQTVQRFVPGAPNVQISTASILDPADVKSLPMSDVVYSWGVLHHTGQMWQAIENAATRVNPGGTFVIAIYNKHSTSLAWVAIKWLYNNVPGPLQRLMYYLFYGIIYIAKFAATGENPLQKERGMDFAYDVVDWIGGYPYEYASTEEITAFVEPLGFETVKVIPAQVGTGCNEFVFRRTR